MSGQTMRRRKRDKKELYISLYNEKEESGFLIREIKPMKVKLRDLTEE